MANDHYCTPLWVLDPIHELAGGQIGLDPCSNEDSVVAAAHEWHGPPDGTDGLAETWAGHGLVFFNPPYSRGEVMRWTGHAKFETTGGRAEAVGLLKDDPTTRWWRGNVICEGGASAAGRIGKRVKFIGAAQSPSWSSVLVYYGARPALFKHCVRKIVSDFIDTESWRYRCGP